jgi:phage protein D
VEGVGVSSGPRPPCGLIRAWGQSLIELTPTISTRHQLHSVTVNGWDRKKKAAFSVTVKYDHKELKLPKELTRIIAQTPETTETITDQPVFSEDEAKRKALGALRNQQKLMVTVKGTTVGLPELRAGRHVELGELGARLSGRYLVTATTHTFDHQGYSTKFTARLETGTS